MATEATTILEYIHQNQPQNKSDTKNEINDDTENSKTLRIINNNESDALQVTQNIEIELSPQSQSRKKRTDNFGSMIKIAESFHRELNNEISSRYHNEEGVIPIVLLNIELDRRKAKIKLFVKLVVYILFFVVYIVGLLNQRREFEGYNYLLTTSIQRELIQQTTADHNGESMSFEEISIIEDFWSWIENVYVHRLFDPHWYSSNDDTYTPKLWHTLGYQTKAIGGFRLAQYRADPSNDGYCYDSEFTDLVENCYSKQESTEDMQCNDRVNCSYIETTEAATYRCDHLGFCGYYQDFAFSESVDAQLHVIDQLEEMKHNRWIDERTRSVKILTNFYNDNFKRWVHADFHVDIDLAGKVEENEDMYILRIDLYQWNSIADMVGGTLEICFILFVFGFVIFHMKLIYKRCKNDGMHGFIRNAKNHWFDWISVINNCVIIIIWSLYITNSTRKRLIEDHDLLTTYISLEKLTQIDRIYTAFNVINLMISTINGISYFQVTDSGEAVYVALAGALPMIISYIPMYIMCICGFALAGQLLFGFTNKNFGTFWDAVFVVIQMNFGLYSGTQALWNESRLLGKIYILALFFIFITFLLNIFLAIIINSWDEFFELRNALASVQQFGIRPIAFSQTVKGWWCKLPLKQVRNAMDNVRSDEIGFDEFVTILDSIEGVTDKHKETILDFFWHDRQKPVDNDADGHLSDTDYDEHETIKSNAMMLKQLFSKRANAARKNLNVDAMHTIRTQAHSAHIND